MEEIYKIKNPTHNPYISNAYYKNLYEYSINSPNKFWSEQAENEISWIKKWDKISDYSFEKNNVYIKWFEGAELNVCYNCVDRHIPTKANKTAIIWQSDNPANSK